MTMGACSGQDPVADEVNNGAAAPSEVEVLPPDESSVTPANESENGGDDPAAPTGGKIPASMHGRWGLTPGDCTSTRGDAKGLMIVADDNLKFYESSARPPNDMKISANSASGDFAFTGEGMTWKKYQTLEVQEGKLVRTESDPMASYTYARCSG